MLTRNIGAGEMDSRFKKGKNSGRSQLAWMIRRYNGQRLKKAVKKAFVNCKKELNHPFTEDKGKFTYLGQMEVYLKWLRDNEVI